MEESYEEEEEEGEEEEEDVRMSSIQVNLDPQLLLLLREIRYLSQVHSLRAGEYSETCLERPPVLKDHMFLAEGPIFRCCWTGHQRPSAL